MPGGFPLGLEICNGTSVGANAASSGGTDAPANASANTLGNWAQIIASTAVDTCGLIVTLDGFDNIGPDAAVDIGIGASGSETPIANQLLVSHATQGGSWTAQYWLPLDIPAGTRIAARSQVDHINDGVTVSIVTFDAAFTNYDGYAGVESIGFTAASTLGTQVDPGGTLNTKGSYVQLTASTARDYAGLFFAFDARAQTTAATPATFNILLDVAIGASLSEQIIIPNLGITKFWQNTGPNVGMIPQNTPIFFIPIQAGTRLAVRAQAANNDATGRLFGVTAYGVYQ